MTRTASPRFRPQVETLEGRLTPSAATHLPISAFLAAQGSDDNFNFGVPGLPQELAWSTSGATFDAGTGRWARVDYTGQDAEFLDFDLGTTTTGTVLQRALQGGGYEITVDLRTHNAMAFATLQSDADFEMWPNIFGYRPDQLAADSSLTPAVVDSHLKVVYDVAPGAPLFWDLVDLNLEPDFAPPEGVTLVSLSFRAEGKETTPTGEVRSLVVSQTGVLARTPEPIRAYGFAAEVVSVFVHGKKNNDGSWTYE